MVTQVPFNEMIFGDLLPKIRQRTDAIMSAVLGQGTYRGENLG